MAKLYLAPVLSRNADTGELIGMETGASSREIDTPESGWTVEAIRAALGCVAVARSVHDGWTVFFNDQGHKDQRRGFNYPASCLTGVGIFGDALCVPASEDIRWPVDLKRSKISSGVIEV